MEQDFNNDFEVFLKQKADQYKLYPSDSVWESIYRNLHSKKQWIILGSMLLIIGSLFIAPVLFYSPARSAANQEPAVQPLVFSRPIDVQQGLPTAPVVSGASLTIRPPRPLKTVHLRPVNIPAHDVSFTLQPSSNIKASALQFATVHNNYTSASLPAVNNFAKAPGSISNPVTPALTQANDMVETEVKQKEVNWLEEMASIRLAPQKAGKFNLQFYFSPTVSYRRLANNKDFIYINQNMPVTSGHLNIDKYVDHKPSIGAELGSNILFMAGNNLIIKTGLQLNYSRYTIKAYKYANEKASIALNSAGHIADTITAFTSYRNFSGYSAKMLQNQYLQVSIPVGAEFKVLGARNLQLSIAGTIQPTYLLFSDTYLLSTDYVNYAKEPSLVRKWNVHTSIEAFVSYKTGGIKWQIGPQFRYQLMSSFNERYPIKEYLKEYGVKFGLSKTLR